MRQIIFVHKQKIYRLALMEDEDENSGRRSLHELTASQEEEEEGNDTRPGALSQVLII